MLKYMASKNSNNLSEKSDWIISAGDSLYGISYVDIFKNMTKKEMGAHVKKNIRTLFNYFYGMPHYQDFERGAIGNMMSELFEEHGKKKYNPKTKEAFEKAVVTIEEALGKFTDEQVVDGFNCSRDDDSDFIHLNRLVAKRVYEKFL